MNSIHAWDDYNYAVVEGRPPINVQRDTTLGKATSIKQERGIDYKGKKIRVKVNQLFKKKEFPLTLSGLTSEKQSQARGGKKYPLSKKTKKNPDRPIQNGRRKLNIIGKTLELKRKVKLAYL